MGRRLAALHERFERKAKRTVSFERMAADLWADYHYRVSDETLRKMHGGEVDPHTCDAELLAVVALYYGVADEKVSPVAADRLKRLADLRLRITECLSYAWAS